ncbi:hypothetical protein BJ138DRAFT_429297 [Hygrophoropsis aurantiaca]|uniref:Uncharacterized protein n=1 Tax=Hygrophoropsis aurantiaca TaxID=72124 RepID=A0ACB8A333_9AGAM|nr:hypothetical protein BJ138DRAFT_429297 [Hygrophoropsis aurantiaca]
MADPGLSIQELQATQTTNYIAGVDHIWNRQWSFTTALYLIARYSGPLGIIGVAVEAMCMKWIYSVTSVDLNILLAETWLNNIFLVTMQAILVIRVYALFNRSKKVLIFLATLYALQATVIFVLTALFFNHPALHEYIASPSPAGGGVAQLFSTTASVYTPFILGSTFLPPAFDTIMLLFALWAFVRHALEAKRANGGWSINVLVRTLVADHLVYFVCFQIWMTLTLAANYTTDESNLAILIVVLDVFTALAVVAGPRMVISLRAIENKTRGEGSSLEECYGDRKWVPSNG